MHTSQEYLCTGINHDICITVLKTKSLRRAYTTEKKVTSQEQEAPWRPRSIYLCLLQPVQYWTANAQKTCSGHGLYKCLTF